MLFLLKIMRLNHFNFSPLRVKVCIKKLAHFTTRDIVLETFLKSPLRMRLDKGSIFPLIEKRVVLNVEEKLRRISVVSAISGQRECLLASRLSLLRLRARGSFWRRSFKTSLPGNTKRSLSGLYQPASLSGVKIQEALVKGYPHNELGSKFSLTKRLIKLQYETYSQI